MIRLDLSREPRWLDLGHGVRLRLAPLTTALMAAARGEPAVSALAEGASNETLAVAMAKALAWIAVEDWEGVGDADGDPVPVTAEGVDALLDILPLFEAFQLRYVSKGLLGSLEPADGALCAALSRTTVDRLAASGHGARSSLYRRVKDIRLALTAIGVRAA